MASTETLSANEVVERGEAIYQSKIRPLVDTLENEGRMLLIDIHTGDWEMGNDRLALADSLHERHPGADLYGVRIGYPAASSLGGALRSFREIAAGEPELVFRPRRPR